jgi:hypothetical protein
LNIIGVIGRRLQPLDSAGKAFSGASHPKQLMSHELKQRECADTDQRHRCEAHPVALHASSIDELHLSPVENHRHRDCAEYAFIGGVDRECSCEPRASRVTGQEFFSHSPRAWHEIAANAPKVVDISGVFVHLEGRTPEVARPP